MSRFIKLTNLIVNANKIIKVETTRDIHYIYVKC